MLPSTHREAIRAIFLRRRSEYTSHEAAQLLRLTLGEFLTTVETGVLAVQVRRKKRQLGGKRHALVTWSELASAALLRWTPMQIHDALGKDAHRAFPRFLRPVELKDVRLPEYLVRLIEALARHAGVSVEAYVYTALLSVETAVSADEAERLLPGFWEAIGFPHV